ncbi:MAG TPA: ComEA family DNA-binding protein [bacterium]|nr:ComEA family DNA-binding protein [bacterium]HPG44633.1 ComEA family DNA-binding protein [bacterium]HPM97191.1 ComEA family DNA-binding protein [bacterium]
MWALNRQEQRAVLFLLTALVVGGTIKLIRNRRFEQVDDGWLAERDQLFAFFQQQAKEEELAIDSPSETGVKKQDLVNRINLNTASAQQLQTLKKIGPALAQRILDYRAKQGPFQTIEDLQKVKGIGPKTFANIKEHITVE